MANEGADAVRFAREVLRFCEPVGRTDFFAVLDKVTKDNTRELLQAWEQLEKSLT